MSEHVAHFTREEWLQAFIADTRPVFKQAGYVIPDKVRVSTGFASGGRRAKSIGECWQPGASADGTVEIYIVPKLDDAAHVAGVLTHDLIHATGIWDHKAGFRKAMAKLGLEGKATATTTGAGWDAWARPILDDLGPFPHARLDGESSAKPKQSTRMLKATCECGYTVRLAKKWVVEVGPPHCPLHGAMSVDGFEGEEGEGDGDE